MEEEVIPEGYRKCTMPDCGAVLPETIDYFQKAPTGRNGLKLKCKQCSAKQAAEYRNVQHEKVLAASRAYHKKESEQLAEKKQQYLEEHPPIPETERVCKVCEKPFPLDSDHFQKSPNGRGGFKTECKICSNERNARYRLGYRDTVLESNRRYRETHRDAINEKKREQHVEHREEENAYERERRAKNREQGLLRRKMQYYAHHDYYLAQHKAQRERRPEHLRAQANREMKAKGFKFCRACRAWWPATTTYFHSSKSPDKPNRTPLANRCKICANEKRKENPWEKRNRERSREIKRRWERNHPEQAKRIHKHWRRTHREQRRIQTHNYRAKKRLIPGTHTSQEIQEQYIRQKGKCYYCHNKLRKGRKKVYIIEHTFPVSRPGARNDISYLVLACSPCNLKKGNKYPWEWPEGNRLL